MSHPKIVAQITTQLANVDKDGDENLKSDEDEKTIQLFKLYLDLNDKPDNEQLIKDFVCDDDKNCKNNKEFLVKNIETVRRKFKTWHDEAYAPRPSIPTIHMNDSVFNMSQMALDPQPKPPVPAGGRKISKKYKKSKKSKKSKKHSNKSRNSKKSRKTKSRRH
jgi:hypothetical protein